MPCSLGRFYESPQWRFVVTNRSSAILSILDHVASNRSITFTLNAPAVATADMPSNNPQVNIIAPPGDPEDRPYVEEGERLLYAFRRECGVTPWICRFGGLIMQIDDRATDNPAVTTITAFDPWNYLYRRPVLDPDTLAIPLKPNGITYASGVRGDEIIFEQLQANEAVYGPVGLEYASFEATATPGQISFQRGSSLGEMLDVLVQTGTLDVVIRPFYDPINSPGLVGEMFVYNRVGEPRYSAVFGWDKFPRSLAGVSRLVEGAKRANTIKYYADQGGVAVGTFTDLDSIDRYGNYIESRFWPNQIQKDAVTLYARRQLALVKDGLTTYTLSPAAERSPIPFIDYDLGDSVPVWASMNLRRPINGELLRVESIPIQIDDNQLEYVDNLLVSIDEEALVPPFAPVQANLTDMFLDRRVATQTQVEIRPPAVVNPMQLAPSPTSGVTTTSLVSARRTTSQSNLKPPAVINP